MKKNVLTMSLLLSIGLYAFGQNVEREEAENVAKSFLSMRNPKMQKSSLSVSECFTTYNEQGEALCHILNFENGGFVIVSGDKRTEPVLAYSTTNNYVVDNSRNPASAFWIENNYIKPINDLKKEAVAAKSEILQKWEDITSEKRHKTYAPKVEPLVTAKWNQDMYYNALCPDEKGAPNGYDYHVPNGCVAVAVAQIMYYHRYPRQGSSESSYNSDNYGRLRANYGATNYNYEAMADEASGYSDAIARLIFHIGVSVEMGYGKESSGAMTENVTGVLGSYFRYNANSMDYITRKILDDDEKWLDTIKYNLNRGLPIYYAAQSRTGGVHARHAFVCDGYDEDGRVHINWGWGGYNDAYCFITEMGPSQYIDDNRILIGIEPLDPEINFFSGTDTITATYGSFNDGSGYLPYRDNTNCSWLISPQGGNIDSILLKVSAFSLGDGDVVRIYAGNSEAGTLIASLGEDISPNTTYSISGSEAFVVFESDNDGVTGNGFTFTYTTSRSTSAYCSSSPSIRNSEKITSNAGSIDNGTPAGVDYVNANSCYWAIAPQSAVNQLNLSFSEFDLADGDVVEILEFPSPSDVIIANWRYANLGKYRFSKDNLPTLGREYTVNAATALVHFKTDNDKVSSGFKLNWDVLGNSVLDNNLNLDQLLVFPNPSLDFVNVSFTVNDVENVQIMMLDMLGKVLYSTPQMEITEQYSEKIDISSFAKGIYLLQINTLKGTTTKKIIVN